MTVVPAGESSTAWSNRANAGYGALVMLSTNSESWIDLTFRSGYIHHSRASWTARDEYGEYEASYSTGEVPFLFGLRLIFDDWFYFRSEVGPVMLSGWVVDKQTSGFNTRAWFTLEAGFYHIFGLFDLGACVLGSSRSEYNEETGKDEFGIGDPWGYMFNLGFSFAP